MNIPSRIGAAGLIDATSKEGNGAFCAKATPMQEINKLELTNVRNISVLRWYSFRLFHNHHIERQLARLQLQPQLFLYQCEDGRSEIAFAHRRRHLFLTG